MINVYIVIATSTDKDYLKELYTHYRAVPNYDMCRRILNRLDDIELLDYILGDWHD